MKFPPKAEKRPYTLTIHGDSRVDNYYWLRDDKRKDPAVLDYLKQENIYSEIIISKYKALKHQFFTEMVERIPKQDWSVPYVKRGYRYQIRYEEDSEYAIYTRQPDTANLQDPWTVLLDGNHRSTQSEFYSMEEIEVSPNNHIMVVAEDFLSQRLYELRFKDLRYDSWFPEVITYTSSSFEWTNDSKMLYYVRKHKKTLLPYQVWRHVLGTPTEQDKLIYEEKDNTFYVSLQKTTSELYILIILSNTTSDEVLLLDANDSQAMPQIFLPKSHKHKYLLDHYHDHFYIRSNRDGKNFALYRSKTGNDKLWQTVIPVRNDVLLKNFVLFQDWLVLEEQHMMLTSLRQINFLTGKEKKIIFDDPTYIIWLDYNPNPESAYIRYNYSSMTKPTTLFEMNLNTGEHKLLKRVKIKNFKEENYHSERIWITARDRIKVPVSLVYRKDLFESGKNPLLVYGYGSYGNSIDSNFSLSRLSLLDRGFIYALIHIRGGGELGQEWYENGKLFNKMNSFNDFIDASRALLSQGYGDATQVFAMGSSAGGLLMGAIINLAPELFKGVIAQVPFVDVVTTMLDKSIPLTTGEYEEWGNPKDKAFYHYMLKYSPYDQVRAQNYPNLLVTTGLYDSQVQYWEPAKWVAKLRELKTDKNILLLCTDMNSGHNGKSGRFKSYEMVSIVYTFIMSLVKPIKTSRTEKN